MYMRGKYDPENIESRWRELWHSDNCFEHSSPADYTIDTPPPTVSGSLHLGHVYQYVIQDIPARFARLSGKQVLFPFGYDNNGIATERYIERRKEVDRTEISEEQFSNHYEDVVGDKIADYQDRMDVLGVSVDWDKSYETISDDVREKSQTSFIELYEKGKEYRKETPAIWCPQCQTAISQAETESLTKPSSYHKIRFDLTEGDHIDIETTRPELLPACVSIFIHPEDDRAEELEDKTAEVPLFGQEVKIRTDERVDMQEGSGVVMCCTFGDTTDIEWYKSHGLDLRVAVDEQGRMTDISEQFSGLSVSEARNEIVEELREQGYVLDSRDISHDVQVHDRCDTPTEYRTTKQWYIEILENTDEYLEAGDRMNWYPKDMKQRYEQWIDGLEWDWCISRQRDVGIPIPAWYCGNCDVPIMPDKDSLPLDPQNEEPPTDRCPECGSTDFKPEKDVFDTWATSSITPLINSGWLGGKDFRHPDRYPMSVRPQGHDIISTWLFYTIVKCYEHTGQVPFDDVLINGHILNENMEKMSASKGNAVDPGEVIDQYPIDAIRYWCAGASIGSDIPYKTQNLESAERLLRKLWNASKLVDKMLPDENGEISRPDDMDSLDKWMLTKLSDLSSDVYEYYEEYEYEKARRELRTFFWNTFCDDYLEVAKQRDKDMSLMYTLEKCHESIIKMLNPIVPFVTEEIWNNMYDSELLIHEDSWPEIEFDTEKSIIDSGEKAMNVVSSVRGWKSRNGVALNSGVSKITIFEDLSRFRSTIKSVTHSESIEFEDPKDMDISVSINYEKAGPKYGAEVKQIESSIEDGEYQLEEDGSLSLPEYELKPDEFEYERVPTSVEGENALGEDVKIRIKP